MANKGNLTVKSRGLSDLHIPELQGKELGKKSHVVRGHQVSSPVLGQMFGLWKPRARGDD